MNDFSTRLDALLKQKGISGPQLAQDIGISKATVSNYLHGRTKPHGLALRKIAMHLGTSEEWLLSGKGPMQLQNRAGAHEIREFPEHEIAQYVVENQERFNKNAIFSAYVQLLAARKDAQGGREGLDFGDSAAG